MKNFKYYKVTVERGHVGVGNSIETVFYFKARDAYDAMCLAKKMPSVKHGKVPLKTEEITAEEYYKGRQTSSYHKEGQEVFMGRNSKYNSKKQKNFKKSRSTYWF